jgi:dTDP-4-dehydrorhamnose 3,5-epimerase
MEIEQSPLKDCFILKPKIWKDDRGYFFENYNSQTFKKLSGQDINFVQDNQAYSSYGVVRGLHMQKPPYAQSKLVFAIQGRILDVAVDARKNSPTFGQSFAIELNDENRYQLFVPKGFLHGYAVLSETAQVGYKCDDFYNKDSEAGIHPLDPTININWGIPADKIILSDKDKAAPSFLEIPEIIL